MPEAFEGESRVLEGAMRDAVLAEQACRRRRLAQRDRSRGLSRDEGPRVVERGEIEDVVVEGVGDVAFAEGALEEEHVHPDVLASRNHLPVLRQHRHDRFEYLPQRRRLGPERLVVAEDRGGLLRDPLGAGADTPLRLGLLLEATVMGARAATTAIEVRGEVGAVPELEPWDSGSAELPRETVLIDAHWDLVRTMMWEFVGIVRTDHRLGLAARYLEIFRNSIEAYYWDFVLDQDLIELRNLALVAELIIQSARARKESRGLHYNEDHPETDAVALPTVVSPLEPAQAAVGAPGNGSHRA